MLSARTVRCFVTARARSAFSLALDEVLLDETEADRSALFVHLWQPADLGIVLGSACRLAQDVNAEGCRRRGVAVYRRITGGGTVLVGPATWCYTFVWTRPLDPGTIHGAFSAVHEVIIEALGTLGAEVRSEPVSDLAVDIPGRGRCKIAGHGQKRRRTGTLCGGAVLAAGFHFPMAEVLHHPPREPPYREGRSHEAFLTSLEALGVGADFGDFTTAVMAVLGIRKPVQPPRELVSRAEALAREKYGDPAWTERL